MSDEPYRRNIEDCPMGDLWGKLGAKRENMGLLWGKLGLFGALLIISRLQGGYRKVTEWLLIST